MKIALIAAISATGTIGDRGGIPWHLREDLQRFKRLTMGHAVIMGRKTFESIGRPLPGRRNLVLSRNRDLRLGDGVVVCSSLDQAIERCRQRNESTVFVIGGANLYRAALPRVDTLLITEVHRAIAGDTQFPEFDRSGWIEAAREEKAGYSFVELVRREEAA